MRVQTVDAIGQNLGASASIGAGGVTVILGLTAYDLAAIVAALVGAAVAVAGLFVQWHYTRRRDRREAIEYRVRMERYERDMEQAGRDIVKAHTTADE